MEPDKKKSVRVKQYFITMPKCTVLPQDALHIWNADGKIEEWVVAQELHKDGTTHLHAYLKYKIKVLWSPRKWDLNEFHGHYAPCKSPKNVMQYCIKDGQFISNINLEALKAKQNKHIMLEDFDKDAIDLLENGKLHPMSLNNFLKNQETYKKLKAAKNRPVVNKHTLKIDKKRHIWIYGETNTGKTTELKSMLNSYGSTECFQIPVNGDWSKYNYEKYLWLDEYKGQLTIQELNKICDCLCSVTGKYISGGIDLNPEAIVIITSNYNIKQCYNKTDPDLIQSLYNRFTETEMKTKFI